MDKVQPVQKIYIENFSRPQQYTFKENSVFQKNKNTNTPRKIFNFYFFERIPFFLTLLLIVFFLKGLVFTVVAPMFHGTSADEYVHYATIQYYAEPKEKTWSIIQEEEPPYDNKRPEKLHYTQEIRKFSELTQNSEFAGQPHNTQVLDQKTAQSVEDEMKSGKYSPYFDKYPPLIVGGSNFYHRFSAFLEKFLSNKSIFERFFTLRIATIFYGLITIICAYFTAMWSRMEKKHSLLLAGIIAFHPQLSATFATVSYDPPLIMAFSLFTLASVSIFSHGINYKNTLLLIMSSILAFLFKEIGLILFPLTILFVIFGISRKFQIIKKIGFIKLALITLFIISIAFFLLPKKYTSIPESIMTKKEGALTKSLSSYFRTQIFNKNRYDRTNITYWGTFGWMDTTIHSSIVKTIQKIEYTSVFGLIFLILTSLLRRILPKKNKDASDYYVRRITFFDKIKKYLELVSDWFLAKRDYLPTFRFLIFFAVIITILQVAIRFCDWYLIYFGLDGIGTPGRYFLPNVIPHTILVTAGLGSFINSSRIFSIILKIILILMVLFSFYSLFLVLIPRYYL